MRRSGRSTRLIDEAVQALFNEGKIFIPDSKWMESDNNEYTETEKEKRNRFIDRSGKGANGWMQNNFKKRIIQRLQLEHNGHFEVDGRWIKLKKEK